MCAPRSAGLALTLSLAACQGRTSPPQQLPSLGFQPSVNVSVGVTGHLSAAKLASADFTGDGHADLAIGYPLGFAVVAAGSFEVTDHPSPELSTWVSLLPGDLDADNLSDLVTVGGQTGVMWLRQLSSHDFERRSIQGGEGGRLAMGDLNGDGLADLVSVGMNSWDPNVVNAGSVQLRGPEAEVSFRPATKFASLPTAATAVQIADVTGDDLPDVVAAFLFEDVVRVWPGLGNGGFGALATSQGSRLPDSLAVGDLDGTGVRSIVVTSRYNTVLSVLRRGPDGAFRAQAIEVGATCMWVTVADLDLDGREEIIAACPDELLVVESLAGSNEFRVRHRFPSDENPTSVLAADISGDGRRELVVGAFDRVIIWVGTDGR